MKNYFGENEIVLVHGTAASPATILKKGFDNISGFWNCSEYDKIYCYEYKAWCGCEGYDLDDETAIDVFIRRANEQGQIQNAILESPSHATSVLEFHLPEDFEEFIEPDNSCQNMDKFGCVQVDLPKFNEYMREGKCKVIVHKFPFCVRCSLLYLTSMVSNPCAKEGLSKLPETEKEVLEVLAKQEFNDSFWESYISWPDEIASYEPDYPFCVED